MQCPLCKADNAAGPRCRRCKADLSMLFSLDANWLAHLARTRRAFDEGRFADALNHAQSAHDLKQSPETLHWLAILHLLVRDFTKAWRLYQSVNEHA